MIDSALPAAAGAVVRLADSATATTIAAQNVRGRVRSTVKSVRTRRELLRFLLSTPVAPRQLESRAHHLVGAIAGKTFNLIEFYAASQWVHQDGIAWRPRSRGADQATYAHGKQARTAE
jgi:hypothetical protein